jgi:hypothetical protein
VVRVVGRLVDVVWARWPLISLFLTGLGVVAAVFDWALLWQSGGRPVDVHAYWVADPNNLYPPPGNPLQTDAYLYSPAFEVLVGWGRHLPFEVFAAIWRALQLAVLVWLAGPLTLFVLFTVPVASEVNSGNIQLFLAAAIVLGFRGTGGKPERWSVWPGLWAFVLLTKVAPGVGLLWFAARRRWRALAVALGVTLAVAAVTFAIWPDRWLGWIRMLTTGGSPAPLFPYYMSFWPRFIGAAAIVLIGAWRGWRWTVVLAATLALPAFYYISPSLLVGLLPFLRSAVGRWTKERGAAPREAQLTPS